MRFLQNACDKLVITLQLIISCVSDTLKKKFLFIIWHFLWYVKYYYQSWFWEIKTEITKTAIFGHSAEREGEEIWDFNNIVRAVYIVNKM